MDGRKLSHHEQLSSLVIRKRQFNKNQSPPNFHCICPEQSAPLSGKDPRLSQFLIGQPGDSRGPLIGQQPLIHDLWLQQLSGYL